MNKLTTYKTLPYESVNIDFTEDAKLFNGNGV